MLTLAIEPTDDRANPICKDLSSCRKWLAKLQLTNLKLAHSHLLTEMTELNRYPMRITDRIVILEVLRDTVDYVQSEYTKKLAGKPLPLNENELQVFISSIQLWQAMSHGYQRCLQTTTPSDKKIAMLCHRALLYSGRAIIHHLKTGYEFEGNLWQQLHNIYAFAESHEIHTKQVSDPQSTFSIKFTCHQTYMQTLLTSQAHPAELTRSQLQLLELWLPDFIDLLTVGRHCSASQGDAQPLAFDLDSSQYGLRSAKLVKHSKYMRYLPMVPLSKDIRVKSILLDQGKTATQVGLGGEASSQDCLNLLRLLHKYWCEVADMRFVPREHNHQQAILYHDFNNIHTQLSGGVIRKPVDQAAVHKQIETFGHKLDNTPTAKKIKTLPSDSWHLDNNSLRGAQLTSEENANIRLNRRQLVAIQPANEAGFTLGFIAWVKVMRSGQLRIGVHYLPGKIELVHLKSSGSKLTELDDSGVAFLLKPLPKIEIPPSLIIPRNWFKPRRIIELHSQKGEQLKVSLDFIVEQGSDFERVSFKAT